MPWFNSYHSSNTQIFSICVNQSFQRMSKWGDKDANTVPSSASAESAAVSSSVFYFSLLCLFGFPQINLLLRGGKQNVFPLQHIIHRFLWRIAAEKKLLLLLFLCISSPVPFNKLLIFLPPWCLSSLLSLYPSDFLLTLKAAFPSYYIYIYIYTRFFLPPPDCLSLPSFPIFYSQPVSISPLLTNKEKSGLSDFFFVASSLLPLSSTQLYIFFFCIIYLHLFIHPPSVLSLRISHRILPPQSSPSFPPPRFFSRSSHIMLPPSPLFPLLISFQPYFLLSACL